MTGPDCLEELVDIESDAEIHQEDAAVVRRATDGALSQQDSGARTHNGGSKRT